MKKYEFHKRNTVNLIYKLKYSCSRHTSTKMIGTRLRLLTKVEIKP